VPANPEDDLRGKAVYDAQEQRIGSVEDLYIDRHEREVRFLEVGAGGFLGIGEKPLLVPVEAITQVAEDRVTIEPGRTEKVEGPAPSTPRSRPRPPPPTGAPTTTPRRRTATPATLPTASTREVTALMVAEDTSPTTTTSRGPRAASYEATQQGAGPLPEASTTPAALSVVLKWTGVALLVIAGLMAVYLGAVLLGELAVWATYP
jgi:sporulation protein YlmC with PRC-barrel domain